MIDPPDGIEFEWNDPDQLNESLCAAFATLLVRLVDERDDPTEIATKVYAGTSALRLRVVDRELVLEVLDDLNWDAAIRE
jgi:hypothetical protein